MCDVVNILQLILFLCGVSGTRGLLCYSCNHIETSEDCLNVVECNGREECFTRADAYVNGSVLYTVGCTHNMVPTVEKGHTYCSEVCNEDLCNLDKCQLPVSPRSNITRPPRCLSCDLIDDPEQCKNLKQCNNGEMCFVRKVVTFGNTRYRLGCMNAQHCSSGLSSSSVFIGKRSGDSPASCSLCCSKDHCNTKVCGDQHAQDDHTYDLNLLGDDKTCLDFNPTACAAFGSLNSDACKAIADVDSLCPASCGICGHYGWTDWGAWSTCSQSCDGGTSVRDRRCMHQLDAARNHTCVGENNGTTNCSIQPCAVHGQWSEWSDWSNCSVTCENGTQIRQRECTNPEPQFGGMNCTGDSVDIEECSGQPCPVDGDWCWKKIYKCSQSYHSSYGYQYDSNGLGYEQTNCNCPPPMYGGKSFDGGWCTERGKTCEYHYNTHSRYSLYHSNAKIRTTCGCPAPKYGGEQCKR